MQQPPLTQSLAYLAKIVAGFLVVALAMIEMFSVPRSYFVLGSLVATTCMICVAFLLLPNFTSLFKPTPKTIVVGVGTAVLLYLIFIAGNALVKSISPLGVSASNENSIYSLFASTPLLLRVVVFVLDAFGFESYFRGVLQPILAARIGVGSAFAVALIDAAIHISSLNSLFVITTFIADSVWGLNFYFTKDLSSSIANHLLWDVLIFLIIPIT